MHQAGAEKKERGNRRRQGSLRVMSSASGTSWATEPHKVSNNRPALAPSAASVAQWVLAPGPAHSAAVQEWHQNLRETLKGTVFTDYPASRATSSKRLYIPPILTEDYIHRMLPQDAFWPWANSSKTLSAHFSLMTASTLSQVATDVPGPSVQLFKWAPGETFQDSCSPPSSSYAFPHRGMRSGCAEPLLFLSVLPRIIW